MNAAGVAHTDVSLWVNRRSGALPLDSSSTFVVWVGEFSGSLSAMRQMLADVPPLQILIASQECAVKHHTSLPKDRRAHHERNVNGFLNQSTRPSHHIPVTGAHHKSRLHQILTGHIFLGIFSRLSLNEGFHETNESQ